MKAAGEQPIFWAEEATGLLVLAPVDAARGSAEHARSRDVMAASDSLHRSMMPSRTWHTRSQQVRRSTSCRAAEQEAPVTSLS